MKKLVIVLIVFLLLIFSFLQVDLRLFEIVAYDNVNIIFKFLAEFFPPHIEKDFFKSCIYRPLGNVGNFYCGHFVISDFRINFGLF